jgi:hypothetical protein
MPRDETRAASDACRRNFQFLIDEFGYKDAGLRFIYGGFRQRYIGPAVGVSVQYEPRELHVVALVRLVKKKFPKENEWGSPRLDYFPMDTVIGFLGATTDPADADPPDDFDPSEPEDDELSDMYLPPTDAVMGRLARRLRACAPILGGEAAPFDEIEAYLRHQEEQIGP